jgi:allantoin racemase
MEVLVMRLLVLIVDDLHPSAESTARFASVGRRWLPPAATINVEPIDIGPPVFFESALGMSLAVPGVVKKLVDSRGRYDAAVLGGFADPGLTAAREVADIPVVGPGEACVHFACLLGARFGIVTLMESNIPVIKANIQSIGLAHRCAAIRPIGIPIQQLAKDPDRAVRRIIEEGERTLDDGADVVVLGCFGFSLLDVAPRMSSQLGVPVVDPFYISVKTAEALVLGGYKVSRRTYPEPDVALLGDFQWFAASTGTGKKTRSNDA